MCLSAIERNRTRKQDICACASFFIYAHENNKDSLLFVNPTRYAHTKKTNKHQQKPPQTTSAACATNNTIPVA